MGKSEREEEREEVQRSTLAEVLARLDTLETVKGEHAPITVRDFKNLIADLVSAND